VLSGLWAPPLFTSSLKLTGMYSRGFLEGEEGREWKDGRGCRVCRWGE